MTYTEDSTKQGFDYENACDLVGNFLVDIINSKLSALRGEEIPTGKQIKTYRSTYSYRGLISATITDSCTTYRRGKAELLIGREPLVNDQIPVKILAQYERICDIVGPCIEPINFKQEAPGLKVYDYETNYAMPLHMENPRGERVFVLIYINTFYTDGYAELVIDIYTHTPK